MKDLKTRLEDRAERKEEAQANAELSGNGSGAGGEGGGEVDHSSKTVAELKAELDKRGIAYEAGHKKADLVGLLEDNDGE
jgi:hypothetical protein